jgi:hypothetical protein
VSGIGNLWGSWGHVLGTKGLVNPDPQLCSARGYVCLLFHVFVWPLILHINTCERKDILQIDAQVAQPISRVHCM